MSAKIYVFASPHQSPQKCKKICMSTIPLMQIFLFLNAHFSLFYDSQLSRHNQVVPDSGG